MKDNNKKITVGASILANEKCPNVDYKYGLYHSKEEVMEVLGEDGLDVLAVGLTVGILTENGVEEYWFKKACDSIDDLVPKNAGGFEVEKGKTPEETDAIDSNKEMQDFLEGYDNKKTLKEILSGHVDDDEGLIIG